MMYEESRYFTITFTEAQASSKVTEADEKVEKHFLVSYGTVSLAGTTKLFDFCF